MRNRLQVAEALHKFLWEVNELPITEYDLWIAHFRVKQAEQERKDAEAKARGKGSASSENKTFGGR